MNNNVVVNLNDTAKRFFRTSDTEFKVDSNGPLNGTPNIVQTADVNPATLDIFPLPASTGCYFLARVIKEWYENVRIFPTQNVVSFQNGGRAGNIAYNPHWRGSLHNKAWGPNKSAKFGIGSDQRAEKILEIIFGKVSNFPLNPKEFSWNDLLDVVYESHTDLTEILIRDLYYSLVIKDNTWREVQIDFDQRRSVVRFQYKDHTEKESLDYNHKAYFARMTRRESAEYDLHLKEIWVQLKEVFAVLEGTVTRGQQDPTGRWGYETKDTKKLVAFRTPSDFWENSAR